MKHRTAIDSSLVSKIGGTGVALAGIGKAVDSDIQTKKVDAANAAALDLKTKAVNSTIRRTKAVTDRENKADIKKEKKRKAKILSMRNFLSKEYKVDTSQYSDDDIEFNGDRIEKIYKDKTSRKQPAFYNTNDGIVMVYADENNKPVTKLAFKSSSEKDEKFEKWADDKVQVDPRSGLYDAEELYQYNGKGSYYASKKTFEEAQQVQRAKKTAKLKL